SPVVIGSIDTGVDFTHPEFRNADGSSRLIAGHDWYSNDNDPTDEDEHGTHTTGTMAGNTVGVAGVSGAGANVRVYVQRVCGRRGCPTSAIVSAIRAAADYPGMVAMNMSLGGASESQAEADAIAYAASKNVLVIASAGNDGTATVSCPACDPNAISVAALNWQDVLAYYSNWGSGLDIAAPGGEMYSNTTEEGGIFSSVPGGYAYLQGTSMAAPQVTGTAGVVASVTGLRGAALRDRLLSTTDDLGSNGYDTTFGYGRLNSYRAATGQTLASPQ
ncbi:MAG TPA: S8 family serine peptidase, partial [Longimicrobiaceae bacterium]|nr:S8 family serine peptidase [Longimicrobiaceae bacterium]